MSEPTPIIIRTIEDLIPLDDRQLEACLADLHTWVKFRQNLDTQIATMREAFSKATGLTGDELDKAMGLEMQDHMTWIDDGISGGSVDLTVEIRDAEGNTVAAHRQDNAFKVAADGTMKAQV